MEEIQKFCRKHQIPDKIERAFVTYCKISMKEYFDLSGNESATGLLNKLTEKEVKMMWGKFSNDMNLSILKADPASRKTS